MENMCYREQWTNSCVLLLHLLGVSRIGGCRIGHSQVWILVFVVQTSLSFLGFIFLIIEQDTLAADKLEGYPLWWCEGCQPSLVLA